MVWWAEGFLAKNCFKNLTSINVRKIRNGARHTLEWGKHVETEVIITPLRGLVWKIYDLLKDGVSH